VLASQVFVQGILTDNLPFLSYPIGYVLPEVVEAVLEAIVDLVVLTNSL
jgi:hypothetical protein